MLGSHLLPKINAEGLPSTPNSPLPLKSLLNSYYVCLLSSLERLLYLNENRVPCFAEMG